VHVRPGLNSDKILKALESVSHVKILEFTHSDKLWPKYSQAGGWFTDPEAHKRFVKRIQFMPSVACCLPMQPGWMWYDMQWDVPHTVSAAAGGKRHRPCTAGNSSSSAGSFWAPVHCLSPSAAKQPPLIRLCTARCLCTIIGRGRRVWG